MDAAIFHDSAAPFINTGAAAYYERSQHVTSIDRGGGYERSHYCHRHDSNAYER